VFSILTLHWSTLIPTLSSYRANSTENQSQSKKVTSIAYIFALFFKFSLHFFTAVTPRIAEWSTLLPIEFPTLLPYRANFPENEFKNDKLRWSHIFSHFIL